MAVVRIVVVSVVYTGYTCENVIFDVLQLAIVLGLKLGIFARLYESPFNSFCFQREMTTPAVGAFPGMLKTSKNITARRAHLASNTFRPTLHLASKAQCFLFPFVHLQDYG